MAAKKKAKKAKPKKKKAKKAKKQKTAPKDWATAPRKRPPWATAKNCTICGHKRHAKGACLHFANGKFCSC